MMTQDEAVRAVARVRAGAVQPARITAAAAAAIAVAVVAGSSLPTWARAAAAAVAALYVLQIPEGPGPGSGPIVIARPPAIAVGEPAPPSDPMVAFLRGDWS